MDYLDDDVNIYDFIGEEDDMEIEIENEEDEQSDTCDTSDAHQIIETEDAMPTAQVTISKTTSLANLCNDEEINNDAKFLDSLGQVLDGHETSEVFLPHLKKIQNAFYGAG